MKTWPRRLLLLSILIGFAVHCAAKPKDNPLERLVPVPNNEPIPIVDFFRPRMFTDPELNPAGTHFAAILSSEQDRHDLVTMELSTGKVGRLTGGENFDVDAFYWFGDDRILFNVIWEQTYSSGLYLVSLARFRNAYPLQRHNVVSPIGFPKGKPDELVVWVEQSAKYRGADGGVYRLNTAKHFYSSHAYDLATIDDGLRAAVIEQYPTPKSGDVICYVADVNGELALAVTVKDGISRLHRLVGGQWIPSPVDLETHSLVGTGDKPGEIVVQGPRRENQPRALHLMNAETAELGPAIAEDAKYDLRNVQIYRDPGDRRMLGIQYSNTQPDVVWLDSRYKHLQASLARTFPEQIVTILGSDKLQKRFFVRVTSDVNPGVYYLIQTGTEPIGFVKLAEMAPWIDSKRMLPMRKITYKARDGKPIEGFVTLPAGASKESPAPLVVLPHGGPQTSNRWSWNPAVQFLASRGYAVFQPNYRGSTGIEWRFAEEDLWAFRKMHDDVTDGVKQLQKTGLIDPDRVAIMGSGFGGYLAICGVANEPDLYRCAVTICGIFDWEQVIRELRGNEFDRIAYGLLRRHLGDPTKQRELFEHISPVKVVGQIKVPVFVAHVEAGFSRFPESRRLITELKRNNIPFEKMVGQDEYFGFYKLKNEIELHRKLELFLQKNLAPRPKK